MEAKTSSAFRYMCLVCIALNLLVWLTTLYYTGNIQKRPKPVVKIVPSKSQPSNQTTEPDKTKYTLTYDDPGEYKGPVVEGWPPGKNRSMELYLRPSEDTFLMRPAKGRCKLLVVVHTPPNGFEARRGVRSTFGQYVKRGLAGDTAIIFLIGKRSLQRFEQTKLRQEQNTFGDILQADMIDHYNNLTLKTLFTLKYFLNASNFEDQSPPPQYLVKVDDDSYLNLPLLWKSLEQNNISQLLMGMKFSQPVPWQVPKGKKNRKPKKWADKWACPKYMYNGKHYPPMLSGSGYVMSRSTAACLYSQALQLPFFHLEDVLVTGFAAEDCGIERRHHEGFRHLPVKLKQIKATDIMLHYQDLKGKTQIYQSGIFEESKTT